MKDIDINRIRESIKAATILSEARDKTSVDLYQQVLREIERCPEKEREMLKREAWVAFARANQKAHEQEIEMLRKLLGN